MKTILKILLGSGLTLLLMGMLIFVAFQVSPKPGAMLINKMFDGPVKMTDAKRFAVADERVDVQLDQTYQSSAKANQYDLYQPKEAQGKLPVLIWVHGGGYVGGDKSGMKEFATNLAADAHVAVVAMNYQLAPSAHYPSQLKQVAELVRTLQSQPNQLDLNRIYIGGDSAGAQIAVQYAAVQTNQTYADEMNIQQQVTPSALKGVISYCGPVNLKQTAEQQSESRFMRFFVKTVAWSLLGKKEWKSDARLAQASMVEHVTNTFPATYVTDGNAFSFPEQGHAFVDKLQQLNVPVHSLFFDDESKQIPHEYQFDYATIEAQKCYEQTIQFIQQQK